MKQILLVSATFFAISLASCVELEENHCATCVAYDCDDNMLFESESSIECESQIDASIGEYCDCTSVPSPEEAF